LDGNRSIRYLSTPLTVHLIYAVGYSALMVTGEGTPIVNAARTQYKLIFIARDIIKVKKPCGASFDHRTIDTRRFIVGIGRALL